MGNTSSIFYWGWCGAQVHNLQIRLGNHLSKGPLCIKVEMGSIKNAAISVVERSQQ
jgi:hypothetical protein